MHNMKRLILFIAILLFGVTGFAQNRTAVIAKGGTYVNVSTILTAADTINTSETYYVEITNKQNFRSMQDIWIELDSVSGAMSAVVTVYGKTFSGETYTSLGSPITLAGFSADTAFNYPITTVNGYRFWKVEIVADGTTQQMLLTDMQFKGFYAGGAVSTSSLILSGTLEVNGESTFNDHINLGAGDDLIGSSTSQIIMNTTAFTADGATGDVGVGNDLSVTNDIILLNGAVLGIAGNEVITFNAAGSINFTGATVDIDGAFTASSVTSDAGVSGTAITGSAEANFTNNAAAVTFGAVATDADVSISTHGTFGDHPESATINIFKISNL